MLDLFLISYILPIMDEKEFYTKLQKNLIAPLLEKYKQERRLSELAQQLGIEHRSRLTELKQGSRKLTFFWLNIFVRGGFMTVDQIVKGRKLTELSAIELDTVLRLDPSRETLLLLYKAKEQGVDVQSLLKSVVIEK